MTITEALEISDTVRRKGKASHVGSGGDGWVHIDLILPPVMRSSSIVHDMVPFLYLTKEDLLAKDWEAKPKCITISSMDFLECAKRLNEAKPGLSQSPYVNINELHKELFK